MRVFKCFYNPTVSIRLETDGTAVSYSCAAADWPGAPPAYGHTKHHNMILFFYLLRGGSVVKRRHISCFVYYLRLSKRKSAVCVSVGALTWLLGGQSQLWVQVRAVVGIYPAFVFLSPAADPVQTNT